MISKVRAPDLAACHLHLQPRQDLRLGFPGAEEDQPGDPPGRDLRPARSQRGGKDDVDQHRVRDRQSDGGRRQGRRSRHHLRIPGDEIPDRARPARTDYRCFRDRLGHGQFQPGLFGRPPDPGYIEKVLRDLALWDKKDDKIMTLSGGMKRRVMIAKALSHEPRILFLDEPTAGVDVELRKDMWQMVRNLRETDVTIVLTTHYINEAEEMADRVGVINDGEIILVEDKGELMRKLGRKQLTLQLHARLEVPAGLAGYGLEL